MTPPRLIPIAALTFAVVAVSSSALFIRLAESPPLVIAAYRMAFATALLLPAALCFQAADLRSLRSGDARQLGLAGIFLAAHFGLWTASLGLTSVASSVVLVSTHPIFVAIAEAIWLSRPLPRTATIGILLTVTGGVAIGYGELQHEGANLLGSALALGGAMAMVGYLIIGRTLRPRLGFLSYSAPVYLVCGATLAIAASLFGTPLTNVPQRDLVIFAILALVPTLGGHTVFNWTLRHLPASVVATAFLGEPVGAALLAWVFLGEVPSSATLVGGSVILAGVYVTARSA